MAIGRLHFPEGRRVCELGGDMMEGFNRVLARQIGNVVIMNAGNRLITPEVWTKHTHEYFVSVNEDGTGAFHRVERQGMGEVQNITNLSEAMLRHVSQNASPMDAAHPDKYPILGPHPKWQDMRVFEVVMFVPDDVAIHLPKEQIEPPRG